LPPSRGLLFADEAMAGLSRPKSRRSSPSCCGLNEEGITIVLIEHIMRAVMSFSTRLVVLVAGQKIATACRRTWSATRSRKGLLGE